MYVGIRMEAITKKQEEDIEAAIATTGAILYKRKDGVAIKAKDIYLYGEINLDNEEDIEYIEKFNFIEEPYGGWIHSNFNYDTGEVTSVRHKFKGYNTNNVITWFKYCYCLLGKPKRVIIYNQPERIKVR